jgi:membrane associated rhomboid family serine protease
MLLAGAVMGIYDREYYRERTRGSGWLTGTAPVCNAIIIINVALFFLPKFLPEDHLLEDLFAAYSRFIFEKLQVWRLITATFLHNPYSIWHIVGNMLFLWMVGREMESFYGSKEFLWLYLSAAALSTLCWALVDYPRTHNVPMIGASGAVMAVVALYTFYYPRREVILFIFPVEMWLLLTLYVANDVLGLLARSSDPTAFAAHLGGFGYAVAFKAFDLRLSRIEGLFHRRRPRLRIVNPDPPKREAQAPRASAAPTWTPGSATTTRTAPTAVVTEEQLDAKLDEILVKIARDGRDSLDDEEKRILEEASRRAQNRRRERI